MSKINWTKIREKYPKSFSKSIDFLDVIMIGETEDKNGVFSIINMLTKGEQNINDRDLYDFFDDQGLRIFITQGEFAEYLDFDIENNHKDFYKENPLKWGEIKGDRRNCETAAFTKAFEILESKAQSNS